jgi:membrane protein YqaA with SNARE-associated domain
MLHRLYARLIALSASPRAPLWLFAVSFAEASFFPLPPDLLLIPMVLARPARAWWLAGICTVGSVAGAALGYWIGYAVFDAVARPVVHVFHAEAQYAAVLALYARYGFEAILIKGLTPVPFKLVTIAAGAAHLGLGPFFLACALTRAGRFFLVEAWPLRLFGDRARVFIEDRLTLVMWALLAAMILGVVALRVI